MLSAQRENTVRLRIEAAHQYINKHGKAPFFSPAIFFKVALMTLERLRVVYNDTGCQQIPSIDVFLDTPVP